MTNNDAARPVEVLGEEKIYSLSELCEICQLERAVVLEFIEYEVIVAEVVEGDVFKQAQLDRLLKASRLQHDLEINNAGVVLALDLLDTIEELKREITLLRRHADAALDL
jgi:chaperone modulatory protein CbpM